LIDFGIARGEDQTAITQTGQAVGTPGYLAPEVVTHHQMSPAADVFALGGVMAFAATGRPPFGTGEAHAVIYRSITNEIDLAGVDPALARLVSACTAKDPAMRPTPDRLVSLSGVGEQLAGDPGYQALLGLSQPVPPDLASAIASGLVSAQQGTLAAGNGATSILATFSARPQRRRSRRRFLTLTGSPVAVVAIVAVVLVSHLRQDSGRGNAGSTGPSGTSSASSTAGVLGEQNPSGTATTSSGKPGAAKKPNAAPTTVLRNRTGLQAGLTDWHSASQSCEPSVPYEEDSPPGLQYSVDRASGSTSAQVSLRFKYDAPAGYYVAAEVREPGAYRGNEERPKFTKPVLMHGTEWSDQTYPGDFSDSFPINKDFAVAGDWTVIWYHVHSDGQAYFIACYGFKV
jgi:serine/threonine protein kinase